MILRLRPETCFGRREEDIDCNAADANGHRWSVTSVNTYDEVGGSTQRDLLVCEAVR